MIACDSRLGRHPNKPTVGQNDLALRKGTGGEESKAASRRQDSAYAERVRKDPLGRAIGCGAKEE
jgi:hypothetical protein|eukprot:jgi/Chrpa1/11832/Chrysochromulina_OHIO_Genome00013757-RA